MPHATCPEREQVKVANRWITMSLVVTAAAMIGYGTIQRDRDAAQEARQAEMDIVVAQMRDDLDKLTDLTEANAAQVFEVQEGVTLILRQDAANQLSSKEYRTKVLEALERARVVNRELHAKPVPRKPVPRPQVRKVQPAKATAPQKPKPATGTPFPIGVDGAH